MAKQLRHDEKWAAGCVRAAMPGVTVEHHDNGTEEGRYDLDLSLQDGRPFGAMEVTAAVDRTAIAG